MYYTSHWEREQICQRDHDRARFLCLADTFCLRDQRSSHRLNSPHTHTLVQKSANHRSSKFISESLSASVERDQNNFSRRERLLVCITDSLESVETLIISIIKQKMIAATPVKATPMRKIVIAPDPYSILRQESLLLWTAKMNKGIARCEK